ncbi:sulfate/molybdate ABC transporter ATP-binding protein [Nocardioides jiangxiensis]|uniref:ATP-binding cassette domain-containing protein n=1 Tax=Nocardioides jiangxiensis TaxID=3064524 RepID=A0ABT9B2S2_9ACTN|nr:ATP-binding cassette domain-containing protein [Nocardioides sp. WY-20]MDO7868513.1 ATP-binding cassette domain-containing protein [Nocardioides sp. WY-20]
MSAALEVAADVAARDVRVALRIEPGETVALLGPNGAGKSTLLGAVAGSLRDGASHVVLGGRTLSGASTWVAPHDRGVGLLAQDALLFPHLDVTGNVAFGPRSQGLGRRAARAAAVRWLDRVGCVDLADRRPGALSGGQAQRVAIARALAAEPEVVLLDEPMAALDVDARPALRQVLREVLRDRTAVIATHDVLDALLLADRVVVLEGGRVVEDGPAAEVLARPRSAFAARVAGLNLVGGRWSSGVLVGERSVSGTAREELPEGADAVAAFRPSAVSVYAAAPAGSPRNAWPVTVSAIEPSADQVRVVAGDLAALVTPQAAAELRLAPGSDVVFVVKANEVEIYPR